MDNPAQVLNSAGTLLTFQVCVWQKPAAVCGVALALSALSELLAMAQTLTLFQCSESIRIGHASSTRVVDIHDISKIS